MHKNIIYFHVPPNTHTVFAKFQFLPFPLRFYLSYYLENFFLFFFYTKFWLWIAMFIYNLNLWRFIILIFRNRWDISFLSELQAPVKEEKYISMVFQNSCLLINKLCILIKAELDYSFHFFWINHSQAKNYIQWSVT